MAIDKVKKMGAPKNVYMSPTQLNVKLSAFCTELNFPAYISLFVYNKQHSDIKLNILSHSMEVKCFKAMSISSTMQREVFLIKNRVYECLMAIVDVFMDL